jgi:hypothetical protein
MNRRRPLTLGAIAGATLPLAAEQAWALAEVGWEPGIRRFAVMVRTASGPERVRLA